MIQDAEIRKIGYARVSTEEQELSLQTDANGESARALLVTKHMKCGRTKNLWGII